MIDIKRSAHSMDASERIVTLSVTREVCEKYMAPMDAILKMEGEPEV